MFTFNRQFFYARFFRTGEKQGVAQKICPVYIFTGMPTAQVLRLLTFWHRHRSSFIICHLK